LKYKKEHILYSEHFKGILKRRKELLLNSIINSAKLLSINKSQFWQKLIKDNIISLHKNHNRQGGFLQNILGKNKLRK